MQDFNFEIPQGAWLLVLTLLLGFCLLWLHRYRQKIIQTYNPFHTHQLVYQRSPWFLLIKNLAWILVWICACIAFMGPRGNLKYTFSSQHPLSSKDITSPIQEVILLVDTSASMSVPDGRNQISRLENAKEIMEKIISQLHGQYISLYAFTSQLTPLVPPTLDYLFTRLMINDLQINEGDVGGTDLSSSLNALKQKLIFEAKGKIYSLILFSDGGDNKIDAMQGENKQQAIQQITSIFSDKSQLDLKVWTVGLGSKDGGVVPNVQFHGQQVQSSLEDLLLKQIAQQGHGIYYVANDWTAWNLAQTIVSDIEQQMNHAKLSTINTERTVRAIQKDDFMYDLYYQIPLGIALILLALIYLLPDVIAKHKNVGSNQ